MKRVMLWTLLLSFVGFSGIWSAQAATFNSTNFSINGDLGNSAAGAQNSTSYKLTSSAGESIAGNSSSGSYKLGQGYIATLENSLQLIIQPNGLTAYYGLNENIGTVAYDDSAGSQNGTLQASPSWTTGKVGTALSFNGSSQYVSLPDIDVAGSAITVGAWVYPTTATQTAKVFSKQSGSTDAQGTLSLSAGKALFEVNTGGALRSPTGTTTLPTNTWSYITGVYDGSNARIYVNGTQEDSVPATGALANNNLGWAIARLNASTSSNYFSGNVDEVKLFSRALTANEVKAEYDAATAGLLAGLSLDNITPGASQTSNFDSVVQTDSPGYTLAINQNNNLTNGAFTIPAVGGSIGSPVTWSEGSTKGLGFTVYGTNATAIPGTWNSGNSYAAIPGSSTTFYTRTGLTGGNKDVINMRLRVDTTTSQVAGNYTNQMTITGTMTP
jgi:hypothetical protein